MLQANITLILLQSSGMNQQLSDDTYIFTLFDFNKISRTPLGTKVVVDRATKQRNSWAYCGINA